MSDLVQILQHIEKRPGMYFGNDNRSRSIFVLQAFIMGFQMAHPDDQGGVFNCFREWVAIHYRVLADGRGGFELILERVGGDERKAYDEFFRVLPDYLRDKAGIGFEGIQLRFSETQEQALKTFRENSEK